MQRIALITGVSRAEGLGFEVARQLAARDIDVILTARKHASAQELATRARGQVVPLQLDVSDPASIEDAAKAVDATYGRLDILINNAAAPVSADERVATADIEAAHTSFSSTFFGSWRTVQAFLPLLARSAHPRIVNVSSGAGSHGDPVFGLKSKNPVGPAYATAKAALNALTAALATELADTPIIVNAVCPGFTATFQGAEAMGARPVSESAAGVLWAALLEDDGPRGGFFRDGKPLPW